MIRERVGFALSQSYYADLQVSVPLTDGLQCPITHRDYWHSFSEIFVQREYDGAWQHMPLPRKWLDLGCHAGYFSLYLLWKNARARCAIRPEALLIDADARTEEAVGRMLRLNRLDKQVRYIMGAIARSGDTSLFVERPCMSSSLSRTQSRGDDGTARRVRVVSSREILETLEPPYDLIKVDLEGGELELLPAYAEVLAATRYVLLEWHSRGGESTRDLMIDAFKALQFQATELVAGRVVDAGDGEMTCGILLFESEQMRPG